MADAVNLAKGQRAQRKTLITVAEWTPSGEAEAVREILGARTEDSSIEFNPDTETTTDILGITYSDVNKTEPQQDFDPYYLLGGSKLGAYLTEAALENNIECLSRNVNGTDQRSGLLADVRAAETVTGFDDGNHYWVVANGHAYLWDYLLSAWKDPSWFYFTNINGAAFFRTVDKSYHMDSAGRVTVFERTFLDYYGPIEKVYQFPPQFFDSYDRLKDILYCIFTVRSDTDSVARIRYDSDYERRYDMTDIRSYSWRLSPRNLAFRCLSVQRFAHVARRSPCCRHVRHFSIRLENNEPAQDLAIISAQIYFRYLGRDR